jgi:hypothetical protein
MAGSYNIVIDQGATWNWNFNVSTNGTPWNLSTYTFAMQVRESTASTSAYLTLPADGTVTMDASGNVSVTVSATKTNTLPAGRWVYDLELTSAGGQVTRLLEGRFIVNAQVTE